MGAEVPERFKRCIPVLQRGPPLVWRCWAVKESLKEAARGTSSALIISNDMPFYPSSPFHPLLHDYNPFEEVATP
jgi:hypothetical protein